MLGERGKIILMGVVLGVLVLAILFPNRGPEKIGDDPVILRPPAIDVRAFALDPKIMARIKDSDSLERGAVQLAPLNHLLKKSYNIGAAAAAALHLPQQSADLELLRQNPAGFRGDYIWVKGKLVEFSEQSNWEHPVERATAYKGLLRTAEGDSVVFWVSKPLPQNVLEAEEKWIRVEGFFMKIVEETYAYKDDVRDAPLLVGPRVERAYPDWKAVDKLDPNVLSRVKSARWLPDKELWTNVRDMKTLLADSQDVPLWHVASYAIQQFERGKAEETRHSAIFELADQYRDFKLGKYEQGSPWRVRGTFVLARIMQANANPVGIDYWTEVWLQIPRMGSKLIPFWIPADIGDWKYGESMDLDGFFFKNYHYRVDNDPRNDMHAPLFVAGGLQRHKMVNHPVTKWIGIAFAVLVGFLALLFFRMSRRAKRESEEYKAALVDRRRKRREKHR